MAGRIASRFRASAMVSKRIINLRSRLLLSLGVVMLLVIAAMLHTRTAYILG